MLPLWLIICNRYSLCFRYLNEIAVRDIHTQQTWHFVCNDWLDAELGPRSIRRTLLADKHSSFHCRFALKATQGIRDQHLWLSIFVRPPHSMFTRVQRLACAMSFIMLAMVTNIMFYGKRKSDDDFVVSFQDKKFGAKEFIISMQCLLINLPINFLVVSLNPTHRTPKVGPEPTFGYGIVSLVSLHMTCFVNTGEGYQSSVYCL